MHSTRNTLRIVATSLAAAGLVIGLAATSVAAPKSSLSRDSGWKHDSGWSHSAMRDSGW